MNIKHPRPKLIPFPLILIQTRIDGAPIIVVIICRFSTHVFHIPSMLLQLRVLCLQCLIAEKCLMPNPIWRPPVETFEILQKFV